MKLLVRNLARTTTEDEILALFAAYGTVDECTLVMDQITGQSKGFAFIEMPDQQEAHNALNALNMSSVAKSKIRVKLSSD